MQQTGAAGQAHLVWQIGSPGWVGEGGGNALWRQHPGGMEWHVPSLGSRLRIGLGSPQDDMARTSTWAADRRAARRQLTRAAKSPAAPSYSHQVLELIVSRIGDQGMWYAA